MSVYTNIVALYCDGGLVGNNPSPVGGVYAWCGVDKDDQRVIGGRGFVPAPEGRTVTNNHTEQIAIIIALEAMPEDWRGKLYSDSKIALGRVFENWRKIGLPRNIIERTDRIRDKINRVHPIHLDGHPTLKQLREGIGKRGNPVSKHNVWCDSVCTELARTIKIQAAAILADAMKIARATEIAEIQKKITGV